jgi:putative oxidoreductase
MKAMSLVMAFLQFILMIWIGHGALGTIPEQAYGFILIWLGLSFLFNLCSLKQFSVSYLISFFSYLIAWRIVALYPQEAVISAMTVVFILFVYQFLHYIYLNLHYPEQFQPALSLECWQLVFVRMYIAFDFIPHFTEKLFAGYALHYQDVLSFQSLQLPYSETLVYLAGLCELGAAIGLGLGIFIRLSALLTTIYLLVATYLGHHFLAGFIWCGPHGGWEFAVLWSILILSFAFGGGKGFSVDEYCLTRWSLPNWLKKIM